MSINEFKHSVSSVALKVEDTSQRLDRVRDGILEEIKTMRES